MIRKREKPHDEWKVYCSEVEPPFPDRATKENRG